ncbi:MAG TPA: VWA domain-containing protein, partial [Luteimonas sp.]|nr:VWA domain-containing protein [Luteimonas sp.]
MSPGRSAPAIGCALPAMLVGCWMAGCAGDDGQAPRATRTGDVQTEVAAHTGGRFDAAAELDRYLARHGRDVEACFVDGPTADTDAAGADLVGGDPSKQWVPARVVMAIDASGSMAARIGGDTKIAAAKRAASEFLSSLPADAAVGLLAFGHRGSNRDSDRRASCAAAEPVYAVGAFNRERVDAALQGFDARGWTPLAAAISAAGRMLDGGDGATPRAVYVVSDGKDTCAGDPIAAARELNAGGTQAVVNVIGFDLAAPDRAELEAVAQAGGGTFTEVAPDGLSSELRRQNGNFIARLRASNANAGTQLRNDRAFTTGLALTNCVF